jgi:hypothetical protein
MPCVLLVVPRTGFVEEAEAVPWARHCRECKEHEQPAASATAFWAASEELTTLLARSIFGVYKALNLSVLGSE